MKETHFFAGSNSSEGFFSLFDSLFDPNTANRIYILKGGPGVGKSTFMKKIGRAMQTKGYDAEYIHCSSDPESLDGIMIPELKTIFVDGTAPHTMDPKLPGAADEIVNLGEYFNSCELAKHKQEIIRINREKSELFQSAYRFLKSAGMVLREITANYDQITDEKKLSALIEETAGSVLPKAARYGNKQGRIRKLFTEAYTANGYISYTDLYRENKKVIGLIGENIGSVSKMLARLAEEAVRCGSDAECCCMPLFPEMLQHLILPELDLMIKSAESASSSEFDEIIDLRQVWDMEKLHALSSEIESDTAICQNLIEKTLDKLAKTKKQHELLEVFYVQSMDFKGVDDCFDRVLSRLL